MPSQLARNFLDRLIRVRNSFAAYVRVRSPLAPYSVLDEIQRRVAMETADYADTYMPDALAFAQRHDLINNAIKKVSIDGVYLEFGVWKGASLRRIAARVPTQKIFGFDSFQGLAEDWKGHSLAKGDFDVGGKLPVVPENVTLLPGWFDKTLPSFLEQNSQNIAFMHIDSDTYEACKIVLDLAGRRLVSGSIVVFDDYFGYRGWKAGEHKAWMEFVKSSNISFRYLAFSSDQASVIIE